MIFNSLNGQNLSGTWLMIKDGASYGKPMFIEFENDQISHYEISEKSANPKQRILNLQQTMNELSLPKLI